MRSSQEILTGLALVCAVAMSGSSWGGDTDRFELELEVGPAWQSKNTVQIPNDASGTRFSLKDLVGTGPWASGRLYFTWNIKPKHSLRLMVGPLSYTETGILDEQVNFAGESYQPGLPVEATYEFNSWRLGYRWKFKDGDRWTLWAGFTANVRDARIALAQGETSSEDTDLGFVPLLSFAADYRFNDRWYAHFDFEGLAGGPGRAIDTALKVVHEINDSWAVSAGYRMLEGGADVDEVYNFAWFQYAVVSGIYRF